MISDLSGPLRGSDDSRAPTMIGVCAAMTVTAMLCLVVRLYTRFRIVKAPGWDDAILTVNMLFLTVPFLAAVCVLAKYGVGRHIYYLQEDQALQAQKWGYITNIFAISMTAIPKFAVIVFLERSVGKFQRKSIRVLYLLNTFLIIISIIDVCVLFVQCRPYYAVWTAGVEPQCWDPLIELYLSYVVGAFSASIDLVLALYPLTFILQVQMKLRKKIGLGAIMGLGIFASGCAIARTTSLKALTHEGDSTWDAVTLIIWCGVEANVITICASVPAIMPIFQRERWLRSASEDTTGRTSLDHDEGPILLANSNFLTRHEGSNYFSTVLAERTNQEHLNGQILATTEVTVENQRV